MINENTTIHRAVEDDVPYFLVSRELAQDSRLRFETRGMLVYLLSKPANWTVSIKDLQREGDIGRDKAYKMIAECVELGYMRRVESRIGGTFAGNDIHVFSTPQLDPPQHEQAPFTEKPDTVEPDTENQDHTYIKSSTEKRGVQGTPPAQLGKRRQRQTPEHMRIASIFGMEAKEMTHLVDVVLRSVDKVEIAGLDNDTGGRELSYAQECAVSLVQVGISEPEQVENGLALFRSEWNDDATPSYRQLLDACVRAKKSGYRHRGRRVMPIDGKRNSDGSITTAFVPPLPAYAA